MSKNSYPGGWKLFLPADLREGVGLLRSREKPYASSMPMAMMLYHSIVFTNGIMVGPVFKREPSSLLLGSLQGREERCGRNIRLHVMHRICAFSNFENCCKQRGAVFL